MRAAQWQKQSDLDCRHARASTNQRDVRSWHDPVEGERAEHVRSARVILDIDLLSDGERIIDPNAQIAHGALDLRVPEQQLDGTQVAGAAVDESGFGPA